ncbi:hypothetical protein [Oerskovia sp. USHLN155]|uniref:hypothetical protein n=1 Tax=Oerskovia sp. USHLN155 TaxID=3081288 RepID=UPI00301B337E
MRPSPRAARFSTLVTGLLVATTLSGCTAGDDDVDPRETATRYGYDETSATLSPVYELVPEFKDPRDGYARDLLAQQCLQGVVEYLPLPPGSEPLLFDERTGQLRFDEQIAQEWGYPHLRLPTGPDTAVPDDVEITSAMHDAMVACGQEADERLGLVPHDYLTAVEAAGWETVDQDEGVQESIAAWRACMEPAGVVDLPTSPLEMPSPSVTGLTGDAGGGTPEPQLPLSEREREVAVTDARCRSEAGYDDAILQARAQGELAAIGQDSAGFDATRRAYAEYEKGIDAVIDELG